jgi:tetratricopeptide (TPR) repeat protein
VREAQARYSEAIELYQRAIAVVPYPIYVAALGDVYAKVGRPEEAKKQYDLVEFIGELNAINKVLYNRELALFYADHDVKLKEALALAQKELEVRRDVYTWDTLAWALYKNGQPHEAADAMTKVLKPGTRDAMLLFHAGMIWDRLGRNDEAKEYLSRALATNARFHIFYAEAAERRIEEPAEVRNQKSEDRSQKSEDGQK